jgi:hypothetical protein
MARTFKVCHAPIPSGGMAWQYFGYQDGKCVHQSRKFWRREADAKRAAMNWQKAGGN